MDAWRGMKMSTMPNVCELIPARGRLLLGRVARKRPTQHLLRGDGPDTAFKGRHSRQNVRSASKSGQDFRKCGAAISNPIVDLIAGGSNINGLNFQVLASQILLNIVGMNERLVTKSMTTHERRIK